MALISYTPLQDGVTGVNAAATNTPLSTIYNDYNGNITDANIAAGAAIAGSKINLASIANPYKFSVYRNAAFSAGSPAVLACDSKTFDTGTNVDVVTNKGRFTAPIAGFYQFNGFFVTSLAGAAAFGAFIYKNGSVAIQGFEGIQGSTGGFAATASAGGLLQLAATDYVEFYIYGSSGTGGTGASQNSFSGFLVSAT